MTDEEKAEEYSEHEQCANCINPQYCQGKDECYDFANIKSHFLAGLKAGKDMAETDLATIAYMQGAEFGYNKAKGELEEENAELKEQCLILADCNTCYSTCKNENIEMKKQLTKAKELIEELSSSLSVVGECGEEECELLNRAEQFLREVEE